MAIPKQVAFDGGEYQRRWRAVQSAMEAEGIDLAVGFSPHNVYYLTGMDSENLFDYQAVCLAVDAAAPTLVIFDLELGRADNSAAIDDIRAYGTFDDPVSFTVDFLTSGRAVGRIALERAALSVARYEALAAGLGDYDLVDAFGLIEGVRLVKSDAELHLMEQAARLTDLGVDAALAVIGDGVEDREVAAAIVDALYRAGSDTLCWGPVVAAGYRAGTAHSTFSGHRIAAGETVFLELTGEVSRYVSPLMRTAIVGEPTTSMQRVDAAVQAALEVIASHARAGAVASDVAAAGRSALDVVLPDHVFHHYFGYPVGIGYPPSWIESLGFFLRTDNDRTLEAGMVFHLPLSIRKYGEYGVNLSQTIVVENDGARLLGESPARLAVV